MSELQRFLMTSPVPPENLAPALWLIIALPLAGAIINGLFGRTLGRANVNLIACAAVGGSFLLSLLCFWAINDYNVTAPNAFSLDPMRSPIRYALAHDYGTWFQAGTFKVDFGLRVDHLSGTM